MLELFTPDDDIIYSYGTTSPYIVTPERKLWIGVLQLAFHDLLEGDEEILKWTESDGFKLICLAVGLRPSAAAKHLKDLYG